MIIRYIEHELVSSGFKKEKINSGYVYSKVFENIELRCHIDENIKLYFFSIYKWDSNILKGSYSISSRELEEYPDFSLVLFKKTIQNMPRYVGK
ncbi:hypothetical protein JGH11_20045, partial [Dysgonomonas sp. Marseille-P4677]|uniref:hypothetical protein n=1 Tax=Dysgonomonas sp. Marseille-P4677 TaxID=2364790 RepID=UPI001913B7EE